MTSLLKDVAGWEKLRRHTPARIGLPRAGDSLATTAHLAFQLDHARARDAVHAPFDAPRLCADLAERGFTVMRVESAAPDRAVYLRRPDLGRRLAPGTVMDLSPCDIVFVLADGLSALAVHRHAVALIDAIGPKLAGWRVGPVVVAERARVALGDEVGQALGAKMVAVLIGERPGLSAWDSLGVYLTWNPRVGCTDAERNCISNVRPEGLGYEAAASTLLYLMTEARARRVTGVMLKDETSAAKLV